MGVGATRKPFFANMVKRWMKSALSLFLPPWMMKLSYFATIAGRHLGKTFR